MANVWKIGSRWSYEGSKESCIISIFRRSGVVFLGIDNSERFRNEVKEGDYFAIADGYVVSAVAKAISQPIPLEELIANKVVKVRPNEPFDVEDDYSGCYGIKVKIVDLPTDTPIEYKKRGTFFRANDDIARQVVSLYKNGLNNEFDIKANTYRILATRGQNDDKKSIIDNRTFYNIPVYQREYAWGDKEVERFLNDIFKGFWGTEQKKVIRKEPLFIGTMQLSYKKYISQHEYEQDIIDGQQRISTIVCLLKYLQLAFPNNTRLQDLELNWLETRVNNGKEDVYLNDMLALRQMSNIDSLNDFVHNRYAQNLLIIKELFKGFTTDEDEKAIFLFEENIDAFVDYVLNDIYFVVVETKAGLSKTIQIFNTINTAGLDLNGNDLFKVRFYEYLHDVKNQGEEAFNKIGDIYKDIKDKNTDWRKEHNWDVLNMDDIRSIYKTYLISKYRLSKSLYSKSTDTFFEELFDVLLKVQSHPEYTKLNGLEMSLNDLQRMVDVAYFWNVNQDKSKSPDQYITYLLIERSRYWRYTDVAYQILLTNEGKDSDVRVNEVYDCLGLLARVFFCWSLLYAKAVSEIHTMMHKVYRNVINYQQDKEQIFAKLKEKINENNNDEFKEKRIGGAIADNRTKKDLVCVLSAYFYELSNGTSVEKIKQYFSGGYDIEHIHANANDEEGKGIDYKLQNSIGNLMVLEESINRSIGCIPFAEKVNRSDSGYCYKNSNFAVVKEFVKAHEKWDVEDIKQRRESEITKISDFLFNYDKKNAEDRTPHKMSISI